MFFFYQNNKQIAKAFGVNIQNTLGNIKNKIQNDNTKTNYQPQENLYQQKECCIVRFFKWLFCCGCCSRDSVNVKD